MKCLVRTVWTDVEQWRRSHGWHEGTIHHLCYLPCASISNLMPDVMHLVDIGLALYALGKAIFALVFDPVYFPTKATNEERRQ